MTTTFVDGTTVVTAAWLNAADAIVNAHAISALQPLTPAANKIAYYTGATSAALADISDYMIGMLGSADAGAFALTLDAQLAAIAALVPAGPHQLVSFTSLTAAELVTLSAFVATLLDDADAAAFMTTLGISTYSQSLLTAADEAAVAAILDNKFLLLAGGTMSGAIAMGNNDVTGLNNVSFNGIYDNGNSGASKTIDWSANGQYQKLTLTANCTLTFTAPPGPCVLHLDAYQDIVGTYQMTLPGTVIWPSTYAANDKLCDTTALARNLLLLRYDGTNYIANMLPGLA